MVTRELIIGLSQKQAKVCSKYILEAAELAGSLWQWPQAGHVT